MLPLRHRPTGNAHAAHGPVILKIHELAARHNVLDVDGHGHIHITDNGIIPMKERMADDFDPIVWLLLKFRGQKKHPA